MTSTGNMTQLYEDIEQKEAEEEEPFICEECSTELNDFDYGSYENYCEECYTKLFHPQIGLNSNKNENGRNIYTKKIAIVKVKMIAIMMNKKQTQ